MMEPTDGPKGSTPASLPPGPATTFSSHQHCSLLLSALFLNLSSNEWCLTFFLISDPLRNLMKAAGDPVPRETCSVPEQCGSMFPTAALPSAPATVDAQQARYPARYSKRAG